MMSLADFLWPSAADNERDERIGELEARVEAAMSDRQALSDRVIANIHETRRIIDRGTREELVRVRHYLRGDEA